MGFDTELPDFSSIDTESFPKQLELLLKNNLSNIEQLVKQEPPHSWQSLMAPLEDMEDKLEKLWAPISHLHAVANNAALRTCYQACLPLLSNYASAIGHNTRLFQAIQSIDTALLGKTQHKIIDDFIQEFKLSGVALSLDEKKQFENIQEKLSDLGNQFENNVLDAELAFELHITDKKRLSGLPEHAINTARKEAQSKQLDGWLLTLAPPCYIAVMTYSADRELRKTLHQAYATRASELGQHPKKLDNTKIMEETLKLRHEKANLLGFSNYAELSLATKMASSTEEVNLFLEDLASRAKHQAEKEFKKLEDFAKSECGLSAIEAWDIAYLSEKKKQKRFNISQEYLRPYFPEHKVIDGLFEIIYKLYGIRFEIIQTNKLWHADAVCYALYDENNLLRGYIYFDIYARQNKRSGAWMDVLQSRRKLADGSVQPPIATLTCNFAKSANDAPSTLSHDEVLTLFHEIGHCLHHVLTTVDYLNASGVHGVEWDAVELPSQFFENWCWEINALSLITQHVDSKETLPAHIFENMQQAKNFQSAMAIIRQLELALFDFEIHQNYAPKQENFIADTLKTIHSEIGVVPIATYNRFPNSFGHIFSGGYAAGYYSYLWAEVLSSDAFSRFEQEGIFNAHTGRDFLHFILEVGGSEKAETAFKGFRGRPAKIDALLKHNGIK